jgi:hypothetical protein
VIFVFLSVTTVSWLKPSYLVSILASNAGRSVGRDVSERVVLFEGKVSPRVSIVEGSKKRLIQQNQIMVVRFMMQNSRLIYG